MTKLPSILHAQPKYIGTTQQTRLLHEADPTTILIDDRKPEELISMISQWSSFFKFINDKLEPSGNWRSFFDQNLTVIISDYLAFDQYREQNEFNIFVKKYSGSSDNEARFNHLKNMIKINSNHIDRIALLRDKLLHIQYKGGEVEKYAFYDVDAYHEQVLKQFKLELSNILTGAIPLADKQKIDFESERTYLKTLPPPDSDASMIPTDVEAVFLRLRLLNNKIGSTNHALRQILIPYLQESFNNKQDHQPHLGLLFAFLDQYKKLQNSINKLPEKYLHLYYVEFLKQKKHAHIPPYAYVYFNLSPYVESKLLEAGTVCLSSIDAYGNSHRFQTQYDVNVSRAQLKEIKTLFFDRGWRETITNKYSVITESFMAPTANSSDGLGSPFNPDKPPSWPTFGEGQLDKEPHLRNMVDTNLGFCISSPVLLLQEGKRIVNTRLNFTKASTDGIKKLFNDVASKEDKRTTLMDVFYKIFSSKGKKRNLTIYLTGSKGWFKVDPQVIKIFQDDSTDWDPGYINISFELESNVPPIVSYDEQLHGNRFVRTSGPSMAVLLNNEREPYLYSFLQKLTIQDVIIDVNVTNLKKVTICNENGIIDISQPFLPFGTTPTNNSYLLVGSTELFRKSLTSLDINIDWFDLPLTGGLFNKKYEDYELKYNDFFVKTANLVNGEFISSPKSRPLFTTKKQSGSDKLSEEFLETKFNLSEEDLKDINFQAAPGIEEIRPYDSTTNEGYFKINLDEPEIGFGHKKYPEILSKFMVKNARLMNKTLTGEDNEDIVLYYPSQPEVPKVNNIRINYTAHDVIDFKSDGNGFQEAYHIHPFGHELIYPSLKYQDQLPFLLPQYEEDGYLILGIDNCKKTEIISLLFQMIPVYYQDKDQYAIPIIKWQYLSYNNIWKNLPGEFILKDETDTFTKTGIIQIKIPADISNMTNIMAPGTFWVRVCATGDLQLLNHTIGVYINAALTRWLDESDPSVLSEPFAPLLINSLDNNVQGITEVIQPFESFGGKAEENFIEFYTRVSERIRHKNRGWTAWDIERILLNHYPDIDQVKCISGLDKINLQSYTVLSLDENEKPTELNYKKELSEFIANKVVVVIVPKKKKYLSGYIPIFNFRMLENVKNYLIKCTSPFVDFKIRNPEFEYLRIQCDIKFTEIGNEGLDIARLKQEITRFICPWLLDQVHPLEFNKELNLESLKDYLKSLDFVSFITKFSIVQIIEDGFMYHMIDSADNKNNINVMKPTKPWVAFIPDDEHYFNIIFDEFEQEPEKVQPPISFKNEYNIMKKTRIIQIKRSRDTERQELKKPSKKDFKPFNLEL